jgi:hypothetical protein
VRESKFSFETVRQISLELPGVRESTAYGKPALKINGKLLAAIPANRSVEPDSLVVRISFEDRDELLATDPKVYYLTEHYVGYDAFEVLKDLLRTASKYVIRNSGVRSPARGPSKPRSKT